MQFFIKTKGVISVFLILIMLPLFTVAVLLVDGTRYQSAKTMIQEAGDLAAYSTIASYNMDLKDEFGLFAIDDDNMSESFKKYFTDTLGFSENQAGEYSDKIQSLLNSAIFKSNYNSANFFNMYNFKVENATATPLHSLSDPGVLQNQIVEYTKYRGIETILERFEILDKFNKVSKENAAAQETVNAIENLSGVQESDVASVASDLARIKKLIEGYSKESIVGYNAMLTHLCDLVDTFCDCATDELAAMAVMDWSLSTYKKNRVDAYEDVKKHIDEIISRATLIKSTADTAYSNAQSAKSKLEAFKSNYPNQEDACKTADEDIAILNAVLEQKETKYSLWYLRQNISVDNLNSMKTKIVSFMDNYVKAAQKAYTKYQTDLTQSKKSKSDDEDEEQEQEKVRYHVYTKSSGEWYGTAEDHTGLGNSRKDFITSAGVVVQDYVGYIDKSNCRIGTVNAGSYKLSFLNKFEDVANNRVKPDKKKDVKELTKEANNAKKTESESEAKKRRTYQTISDTDALLLPSKCSSEQGEANIPELKENSASSTLSSAKSNSNDILSKFLNSATNDILTYCYILDNFKTRITEKNINSSTDRTGIHDRYLANWRYKYAEGEKDMRYRAKNGLDTFFTANEVEYVFGGCKSEFANETLVFSWIYGTRFINNFIAVYSAYNSGLEQIRVEIDALAAAASAATLGTVPFTVFKWIFITAWAAGETAVDAALLCEDGFKIPLIKTKDNIFVDSVLNIASTLSYDGRKNLLKYEGDDSWSDKINVCYEDYLIILLAFVDRETRLKRVGDLIQLNMRKRCDSEFTMADAYTYIKADTTVSMKYMFQPIKQFSSTYKGNGLQYTNTIYQGY